MWSFELKFLWQSPFNGFMIHEEISERSWNMQSPRALTKTISFRKQLREVQTPTQQLYIYSAHNVYS